MQNNGRHAISISLTDPSGLSPNVVSEIDLLSLVFCPSRSRLNIEVMCVGVRRESRRRVEMRPGAKWVVLIFTCGARVLGMRLISHIEFILPNFRGHLYRAYGEAEVASHAEIKSTKYNLKLN